MEKTLKLTYLQIENAKLLGLINTTGSNIFEERRENFELTEREKTLIKNYVTKKHIEQTNA